jgi:hypothetical protein
MEGRHQDKSKKISDIFHNAADSEHSKLQWCPGRCGRINRSNRSAAFCTAYKVKLKKVP